MVYIKTKPAVLPSSKKKNTVYTSPSDDSPSTESQVLYSFWSGIRSTVQSLRAYDVVHAKRPLQHSTSPDSKNGEGFFIADHPLKLGWDFLVTLLVIFSIVLVPYRIGFNLDSPDQFMLLDTLLCVIFGLDMLVTLNTAYRDRHTERYVFSHRLIAYRYLHGWFWADLLATIPFDIIFNVNEVGLLRILRLFRLSKIYSISLTKKALRSWLNPSVVELFTLLAQLFFVAHVFACFWHFITLPASVGNYETSWIIFFGYEGTSVGVRYIVSLYFTVVTMMMLGYGDIYPTNDLERFYTILMMTVGGVGFGAMVAKLSAIIDKRDLQSKVYNERMREFKSFLASARLPVTLREQATLSFSYYLSKKSVFDQSVIFEQLPPTLQEELVEELYQSELRAIPIFGDAFDHDLNHDDKHESKKNTLDKGFVARFLSQARPYQLSPNHILYNEGDVVKDIIVIKRGSIRLLTSGIPHALLAGYARKGNFLGDMEFLHNSTALATYVSIDHTLCLALSYECFEELLSAYPHSRDIIMKSMESRLSNFRDVTAVKADVSLSVIKSSYMGRHTRSPDDPNLDFPPRTRERSASHIEHGKRPILWIDGLSSRDILDENFLELDSSTSSSQSLRAVCHIDGKEVLMEIHPNELSQRWIIHHEHPLKIAWDVLMAIFVVYCSLLVPVEIAFGKLVFEGSNTVQFVICGFFFADIIFSFRTTVNSSVYDAIVVSDKLIAKQYGMTWFLPDLISAFPFDEVIYHAVASAQRNDVALARLLRIVRLLRLLRLARVFKPRQFLEAIESRVGISPALFHLLGLLLQVFFMIHLLACLWWGLTSTAVKFPWYRSGQLEFIHRLSESNLSVQYLTTLYYVFSTMTTVGFGDIYPTNSTEQLFAIFLVVISVAIFGYFLANISEILARFTAGNQTVNERLGLIRAYLNEQQCPITLQEKVLVHCERKYKDETIYNVERHTDCLPPSLRTEVLWMFYRRKMEKIPLFQFMDNRSVILYIFRTLRPRFCEEGSFLCREGEDAPLIMFLVSGSARVFRKLPEKNFSMEGNLKDNLQRKTPTKWTSRKWLMSRFGRRNNTMADQPSEDKSIENRPEVNRENSTRSEGEVVHRDLLFSHESTTSSNDLKTKNSKELPNSTSFKANSVINTRRSLSASDIPMTTLLSAHLHHQFLNKVKLPTSTSPVESTATLVSESSSGIRTCVSSPDLPSIVVEPETVAGSIHVDSMSESSSRYTGTLSGFEHLERTFSRASYTTFHRCGFELLGDFQPRDFFGHVAAMCNTTHAVSIRTTQASTIYALHRSDLERIIRTEPAIGMHLQTALSRAIAAQAVSVGRRHMHQMQEDPSLRYLKRNYHPRSLNKTFKQYSHQQSLNLDVLFAADSISPLEQSYFHETCTVRNFFPKSIQQTQRKKTRNKQWRIARRKMNTIRRTMAILFKPKETINESGLVTSTLPFLRTTSVSALERLSNLTLQELGVDNNSKSVFTRTTKRRQSYPSNDNREWRMDRLHTGAV